MKLSGFVSGQAHADLLIRGVAEMENESWRGRRVFRLGACRQAVTQIAGMDVVIDAGKQDRHEQDADSQAETGAKGKDASSGMWHFFVIVMDGKAKWGKRLTCDKRLEFYVFSGGTSRFCP